MTKRSKFIKRNKIVEISNKMPKKLTKFLLFKIHINKLKIKKKFMLINKHSCENKIIK